RCSCLSRWSGPITLDANGAGARSAANPHAACDAAGTGDGGTATSNRAQKGKPWIQPRSRLRITAPVPDPTRSYAGLSAILHRPGRTDRQGAPGRRNLLAMLAAGDVELKNRALSVRRSDFVLIATRP